MDTPKNELRQRLRELLSVPERERTDAQWDEIIELEIRTAPGNQIDPNRGNEPLGGQNFRQPRPPNKPGTGHPNQQRKQGRRPNKHPSQRGGGGGTGGGNGGNDGGNGGGGGGGNPPPSAQ
jgi:hypothetical protein